MIIHLWGNWRLAKTSTNDFYHKIMGGIGEWTKELYKYGDPKSLYIGGIMRSTGLAISVNIESQGISLSGLRLLGLNLFLV